MLIKFKGQSLGGNGKGAIKVGEIVMLPASKLVPLDWNPRLRKNVVGVNKLREVIREHGFRSVLDVRPLSNGTYEILVGNHRFMAGSAEGMKEFPCMIYNGTREQAMARCLSDNKSSEWTGWDKKKLNGMLSNMKGPEALFGTGFSELEIKRFERETNSVDLLSDKKEEVGKSMVLDLKQDVEFEGSGDFDFPTYRKDMLYDDVKTIEKMSTWAGRDVTETKPPYFYNYNSDSTVDMPWEKTVIGFYIDDVGFERVWTNTAEAAKRLLNRKVLAVVAPNFSTYMDWPRALRIYNIFRSRWVARYFQEAGIKVIPDVQCTEDEIDCVAEGIPRGSVVSIQIHQKHGVEAYDHQERVYAKLLPKIAPKKLLLYGTKDKIDMFPVFKKYNFTLLTPRVVLRRKVMDAGRRKGVIA